MNYIEILLKDVQKDCLDMVFCDYLAFNIKSIISSHFFNKDKNRDMKYQDIRNFKKYFSTSGTCSIYLKNLVIGAELQNVFILVACDDNRADITINFHEGQFENNCTSKIETMCQDIYLRMLDVYRTGVIEEIIIGYEPVEDDDMKVISIRKDKTEIFNEEIFKSPLALAFYKIDK